MHQVVLRQVRGECLFRYPMDPDQERGRSPLQCSASTPVTTSLGKLEHGSWLHVRDYLT